MVLNARLVLEADIGEASSLSSVSQKLKTVGI